MGACDFWVVERGKTAQAAFDRAVKEARYLNGHGGYTGTIAEKNSFVMIVPPAGVDRDQHARNLLDDEKSAVADKWGPAGCLDRGDGSWLFFGVASS